jgi:hypothetical protein
LPRWMPSELPRSKEALVFAWGANASALPLFPAGGEIDWRIRSTGPQDYLSGGRRRAKTHRRRSWSHSGRHRYLLGPRRRRSTMMRATRGGHRRRDDHTQCKASAASSSLSDRAVASIYIADRRRRVFNLSVIDAALVDAFLRICAVTAHEVTPRIMPICNAGLRQRRTAPGNEANDR